MIADGCYLLNIANKSKIQLNHMQIIYLGRNTTTEIEDLGVSKQQMRVTSNFNTFTVHVKAIGKAISGINGFALKRNQCYRVFHNDQLEVKLGQNKFKIVFSATPVQNLRNDNMSFKCITHSAENFKRKADDLVESPKIKRSLTTNNSTEKQNVGLKTNLWEDIDNHNLLIYTPPNMVAKSAIAAFDLDGTIIKTKSGARFPKDINDWTFNYSNVVSKLKQLHSKEYKIVIFTNQGGLGLHTEKIESFKKKIENILTVLKLPIQVFISPKYTIYRKPAIGMWNILEQNKNNNVIIDINNSFYVGDAAGRPNNWQPKRKKDHSNSDRLFAINLGLKFYTPEEYFLNEKAAPFDMPVFDPRNIQSMNIPNLDFQNQEVVLMVGVPASGKSHFCKNYLIPKGYVYVNRDKLGTWQNCIALLEKAILDGKSVVVDNTNVDVESRSRYIDIAKKHNLPCRCFLMKTGPEHIHHNLKFRQIIDPSIKVNQITLNAIKKKYKAPELSEGFTEIIDINFVPKFSSTEHEELYKKFLT